MDSRVHAQRGVCAWPRIGELANVSISKESVEYVSLLSYRTAESRA